MTRAKTVLCYGDSNTWGAAPMVSWEEQLRFHPTERWTGIFEAKLGADWRVMSEGLPGRTTVLKDPIDGAHLSGLSYLKPCLDSHRPIDVIVLMLGTNDFKRRFGMEAEDVADASSVCWWRSNIRWRHGDLCPSSSWFVRRQFA